MGMALARRLPDGRIEATVRGVTDGIIAEGLSIIGPDHPAYAAWDAWLTAQGDEDDDR